MSRVLIVDDEPHVRELLRDFLAGQGYEVSAVATGAQALDAVPTFQPDVILVDMLMPGLSGADVLDALHRVGVTVPVILISGHHQATVREGFSESPASAPPSASSSAPPRAPELRLLHRWLDTWNGLGLIQRQGET